MKTKDGHHPIVLYVLVVYLISWLFWLLATGPASLIIHARVGTIHFQFSLRTVLQWAGVFIPGIIALFFLRAGQPSLGSFFRHSFIRRGITKPTIGALFISLSASLPTLLLYAPNLPSAQSGLRFMVNTAVNLPLGPFWEEIGWRGFLFPKVQSSLGTLRACLLVGLVWGFWHLPLRISSGAPPGASRVMYLLTFCAYVCALSFVLGWLYNRTKGALLPCIVLHSAVNALSDIVDEPIMKIVGLTPLFLSTAMLFIVAILLHWLAPGQTSDTPDDRPARETA